MFTEIPPSEIIILEVASRFFLGGGGVFLLMGEAVSDTRSVDKSIRAHDYDSTHFTSRIVGPSYAGL